jgi:hypothetical protein
MVLDVGNLGFAGHCGHTRGPGSSSPAMSFSLEKFTLRFSTVSIQTSSFFIFSLFSLNLSSSFEWFHSNHRCWLISLSLFFVNEQKLWLQMLLKMREVSKVFSIIFQIFPISLLLILTNRIVCSFEKWRRPGSFLIFLLFCVI